MILNPFKKVVSWYELKNVSNDNIKQMLLIINKVPSIDSLPLKERKNYIIVRQRLVKEAKKRGIL